MFRAATIKSRVSLPTRTRAGRDISIGWRRGFSFAGRKFSPTPWFVDEETGSSAVPEQSDLANRKHEKQAVARHLPLPNNLPNYLRELHAHLITLPLLDSVSVVCTSSRDFSLEDSLPALRPHGKRKRGGYSYGSDGVGDPPPIWEWILEADLKEGAEKRGAVEAVLRSVTKVVRNAVFLNLHHTSLTLHCDSWPRGSLKFHSQLRLPFVILVMAGVSWT